MDFDMHDMKHDHNHHHNPKPCVINVRQAAIQNCCFRKEIWTGEHVQVTLMCIPKCDDIGWERHDETDQMVRVEQGRAVLQVGECREKEMCRYDMEEGDVAFIPECTWHNIVNVGNCPLKLSSVYAPPHHKRGTVQQTKEDAE